MQWMLKFITISSSTHTTQNAYWNIWNVKKYFGSLNISPHPTQALQNYKKNTQTVGTVGLDLLACWLLTQFFNFSSKIQWKHYLTPKENVI